MVKYEDRKDMALVIIQRVIDCNREESQVIEPVNYFDSGSDITNVVWSQVAP